jgi:hypothetical protein
MELGGEVQMMRLHLFAHPLLQNTFTEKRVCNALDALLA